MLTALLIRRSDAEQGNGRSSICPCPTRGRTVCWVSHAGGGRCVCVGRGEERCGGVLEALWNQVWRGISISGAGKGNAQRGREEASQRKKAARSLKNL